MNEHLKYSIENIKNTRKEITLQILLVFILPILLVHLGFIPLNRRVLLMAIIVVVFLVVLFVEKWSWRMLGVQKSTFKKYLLPYAIFTLVMTLLITQFGESITKVEELSAWWNHQHFLYTFFVVSVFQEIIYRGYLMPALGRLFKNPLFIIALNTALFVFLHTIFPNPLVGLPVALVGGLGFAIMYYRYPSLPLIILSHSLLNFYAVLYGFFVIPGITY
ncbi:MAG: hypothetical protein JWL92_74 [Candidatus Nomurabacteria bacterium]|nr:hypothetical protein [Candidatus Nomurabacteria bacterium]